MRVHNENQKQIVQMPGDFLSRDNENERFKFHLGMLQNYAVAKKFKRRRYVSALKHEIISRE